jgi:uncharacterized protein with HEPN domain
MRYTDQQRLKKIVSTGEELLQYLDENQISEQRILTDHTVQWTVSTPLSNIGEQVYHLSDALKGEHPEVGWNKISGLRHRLVHDYEGTNWNIIVRIILIELPVFIDKARTISEASTK